MLIAAIAAHGHDMHVHASCSIHTDYDVDVQPDSILFSRADGTPRAVRMHDGRLQVDGEALAVSGVWFFRVGLMFRIVVNQRGPQDSTPRPSADRS